MKKWVCVLLVLSLMCCGFALGENDEDSIAFEPTISNLMDTTAKEMMANSMLRAMVTVTIAVDMQMAGIAEADGFEFGEPSYVGKDGANLILYIHAGEKDIIAIYCPLQKEANYLTSGPMRDAIVEMFMEEVCSDGYYENDLEDLMKVATAMAEAVGV